MPTHPERERLRADHAAALEHLERKVEEAVAEALARILTAAFTAAHAGLVAAGDNPDLNALSAVTGDWLDAVDRTVGPALTEVYEASALHVIDEWEAALELLQAPTPLAPGPLKVVLRNSAHTYLRDATNRLSKIGDTAWSMARRELEAGMAKGETIPQLGKRVQDTLQIAEARARTIARTETLAATNAGSVSGARVLGAAGPPFKEWLATKDVRTRDTHWLADGQVVAVDDAFIVGGSRLDYPGDPGGPAREVVNCRCTVIYRNDAGDGETGVDRPGRVEPLTGQETP